MLGHIQHEPGAIAAFGGKFHLQAPAPAAIFFRQTKEPWARSGRIPMAPSTGVAEASAL
jgi:hypothetical protein